MIGSNLVKRLVGLGDRVVVADDLSRGRLEYLEGDDGVPCIDLERDFHRFDLSIPGAIDSLLPEVDLVFHLADVVGGIEYVFQHQGEIFRQNLLINSNVIASVRSQPVRGFVYVGTACSFPAHLQSGVDARPLREEDLYPAAPESSYGWSKLMGQYETELLEQESGMRTSTLVLHNVYGTPTDFGLRTAQVIPALIRKAINYPDEPYVVLGTGAQGRAFVHVDDAVDALIATMERGLGQGIIQIGPSVCTSIRDVAELIVEISGKDIAIEYDRTAPEGDRGRCADYGKANDVLGWTPSVSLRDGIERLYEWIAERSLERSAEAIA
ncbi:MAG: NAD-dependent epimerase/dehydratase family protein [Actinobacteria bacterium]|nr:NAD-dependent epimerase/dehydratase family protein [Actinomycetota bacterium]